MTNRSRRGSVTLISEQTMSEAVISTLADKLTDILENRRDEIEAFHNSNEPYSCLSSAWLEPQDPAVAATNPPCVVSIVFGNGWKARLVFRIARNLMHAETNQETLDAIEDALASMIDD